MVFRPSASISPTSLLSFVPAVLFQIFNSRKKHSKAHSTMRKETSSAVTVLLVLQLQILALLLLPSATQGFVSPAFRPASKTSFEPLAVQLVEADDFAGYDAPEQRGHQTPVQTLTNVEELLNVMDSEGRDELVIVKFFAHYCKLCHKASIPYKKLAYQNPDIRFTRLETSALATPQLKALGVSRVPFVQIYRRGVCVASFSTKLQLEAKLSEALTTCRERTDLEWYTFLESHGQEIRQNVDARKELRAVYSQAQSEGGALPFANNGDGTNGLNGGIGETMATAQQGPIHTLTSESQLADLILNTADHPAEEKPTTVVMFHSHFEKSCARAQHQFRRIADRMSQQHKSQDESPPIRMTRIEASVLSDSTLREFGVQKYPHIHIYRGEHCVASFSIPQTYMFDKMVYDSIDAVQKRSSAEWDQFYNEFSNQIQQNQAILQGIRSSQMRP